jgi:hypothetical protein
VSKQHEEWDILGRLGEKILAQASMFQELKLALVHREIQRMANDKSTTVSWTAEKRDKFKVAWKAANDAEQESFTFDENEYMVTYGRYLIEYLDNVFGEAA